MNLLTIADEELGLAEAFADQFDKVTAASIADVRLDTGREAGVLVDGEPLDEYDALYIHPNPKIAIFSRVFLEALLDRDITANIDPTAFFVLAKKSYLFQTLAEKDVSIPRTAVVSTEKGISGLPGEMTFPLVGKKFEGFDRRDMSLLKDEEELRSFVEHMDHGAHILVLQEQVEGDVYDTLYIDGDIVSIKLEGGGWRKRSGEANQSYHSISSDLQETVTRTAESIGAKICRVRLVNGYAVDAELVPDLERFKRISGKNVYGSVANVLKEE